MNSLLARIAVVGTPQGLSKAITWPWVKTLRTQSMKQSRNWSGSIRANTRLKVSEQGIPLGSSRNFLNHSYLLLANNSTSFQPSAPPITAQMVMAIMSKS